ncbi:Mur ligase central domain-containing protein [Dioscorea alata]|uniref:Mur ligase central domain-containing protein n=1 Tax=Dioscorea alata TaxID=55571 RepID=A0ACB7UBR1_DIOAL|nr:Mur ligase central domain-containing protein [Dioscorea alata]
MDRISTNFQNFVDLVSPEFRALAEAAARNAESAARTAESAARKAESAARNVEIAARNVEISARNIDITARNDAARAEIEEKKKRLGEVLFAIDGLSEDEAMFMLQVLAKDEDQLKVFWELPVDKKLRFCRVFLSRMSYCPRDI